VGLGDNKASLMTTRPVSRHSLLTLADRLTEVMSMTRS
jgi:hypothetical protein